MTSTNPLVLRVGSPRALIESIPHLLGFVPAASLVIVLLRPAPTSGRDRVVLTVRFDLPTDDQIDAEAVSRSMATAIASSAATAATVVAFAPLSTDVGAIVDLESFTVQARSTLAAAQQALRDQGLRVQDILVVSGDRFRSLLCADERCCPPGGAALSDASSSEVAARMAFAGQPMPASRRTDLEQAVRSDPARTRSIESAMRAHVEAAAQRSSAEGASDPDPDEAQTQGRVRRLVDAMVRFDDTGDITSADAAAIAWALITGRVRDHAVRWIIDAAQDDATTDHRAFWECMARSLPSPFDAPAAALAALAAAMDGDGAAVNIALDRADAALQHPEYIEAGRVFRPLVTNLDLVLRAGWPPEHVVAVLAVVYRSFDPVACPPQVRS